MDEFSLERITTMAEEIVKKYGTTETGVCDLFVACEIIHHTILGGKKMDDVRGEYVSDA